MRYFGASWVCLGMIILALGACAARPHGTLTPVATRAPGASEVAMLVVTTRSRKGAQPGELFTGERGDQASFADIAVSIPPDAARKVGEIQWPDSQNADPSTQFATLRADVLDEHEALTRFDRRIKATRNRHVLIFVHGYNTRFEEAVYRFAQILHDSRAQATPVLFSWPSRGHLLAYGYDHESASYSRDPLDKLLRALVADTSVEDISILAHSMGNQVALEALRQVTIREGKLPGKIKDIMLAAPDVDFDVFQRHIFLMGPSASRVTLFISRDDDALAASRKVWGDKVRAGAIDPDEDRFRQAFAQEGLHVVDLTHLDTSDPLRHGKFAEAPEIVRAIGSRLSEGQTLSDAQPGIGSRVGLAVGGAGAAVETVVGGAVEAPFAVVDPRAREDLSDRLEQVGARVRNGGD